MNSPQPDPDPQTPPDAEQQPNEAKNVSREEVAKFVTSIKNVEQQVGEHVIAALQHGDTVTVSMCHTV